jgi:hypothetical protein
MSLNSELRKIALATQFGEVLEIVDINDYSIKRNIGKGGIPVSASMQINGYYDVKWMKNEIYALYSARTEDELRRQHSQGERISGGDMIQVFSQDGQYSRVRTSLYPKNRRCAGNEPYKLFDV